MNHVPRMVARPPSWADCHGGNATVPACAQCAVTARTGIRTRWGGGGWAEHLRCSALESFCFFCGGHPRSRSGLAGRARAPAGVAWGRPFDPHGKIEKSYRHRGTRGAGPRGEMPMGRISANFPVLHPCCQ